MYREDLLNQCLFTFQKIIKEFIISNKLVSYSSFKDCICFMKPAPWFVN